MDTFQRHFPFSLLGATTRNENGMQDVIEKRTTLDGLCLPSFVSDSLEKLGEGDREELMIQRVAAIMACGLAANP